jgi:hypothetical protein
MLRVDTERRFLPRLKNRGLAPSNVSTQKNEILRNVLTNRAIPIYIEISHEGQAPLKTESKVAFFIPWIEDGEKKKIHCSD